MFRIMTRDWIHRATAALAAWHQKHLGQVDFMYILAVAIGLLTGAGAALLKWAITAVRDWIFSTFDITSGNIAILALPVVGILLAVVVTRYLARHPMDHCTDRLKDDMAQGRNALSPRLILGPIAGCAITLGMGGSAGGEDPIAYTGAAVGSNVGRAFRLDEDSLAVLAGCGAAAGIAGIFMAPIGGVMYALEVLRMRQSLQSMLAVVFASLVASITCYVLLGLHADITFMPALSFDVSLVPHTVALGVVCGLYSAYYSGMMRRCRSLLGRFNSVWVKALLGGLTVAALLYVFPSLYGEGYGMISKLMADEPRQLVGYGPLYGLGGDGAVLLALLGGILLVKPLAVSATNDTGGVAGDFTPTFFCGAICGFVFAAALNMAFGWHLSPALFAFMGMAAVMAGAISAPLMGIFIASEMTGLYSFIFPLTIAATLSYLTAAAVRAIANRPRFEKAQEGQ